MRRKTAENTSIWRASTHVLVVVWYSILCMMVSAATSSEIPAREKRPETRIRQVICLSRHGVRGPFGPDGQPKASPEALDPFTNIDGGFPWSTSATEWGTVSTKNDGDVHVSSDVDPSQGKASSSHEDVVTPLLTIHGAKALRQMGKYVRQVLYPDLFSVGSRDDLSVNAQASPCPLYAMGRTNLNATDPQTTKNAELAIYADANSRDNATAYAFMEGFVPECFRQISHDTYSTRDRAMTLDFDQPADEKMGTHGYGKYGEIPIVTTGSALLFNQGETTSEECPICSKEVLGGLLGNHKMNGVKTKGAASLVLSKRLDAKIHRINQALECCKPSVCHHTGPQNNTLKQATTTNQTCKLDRVVPEWKSIFFSPWRDPLSLAQYFSEFFLLSYLNNMTIPHMERRTNHTSIRHTRSNPEQNRPLTEQDILDLSQLHAEFVSEIVTNDVMAQHFGSTLLTHFLASFVQTVTQKPIESSTHIVTTSQHSSDRTSLDQRQTPDAQPRIFHGLQNRFLYYAAHDINICFIRRLLGMNWYTNRWWPNQPTPGSMIFFELHEVVDEGQSGFRSREEKFYVLAYFVSATPEQIRGASDLNPLHEAPERVPLTIPRCNPSLDGDKMATDKIVHPLACPFPQFKRLVAKALKGKCVSESFRDFIQNLTTPVPNDVSKWDTMETLGMSVSAKPNNVRTVVVSDVSLTLFVSIMYAVVLALIYLKSYRCTGRSLSPGRRHVGDDMQKLDDVQSPYRLFQPNYGIDVEADVEDELQPLVVMNERY